MSASRRRSGDQSRYRQVDGTIPSFPSPVDKIDRHVKGENVRRAGIQVTTGRIYSDPTHRSGSTPRHRSGQSGLDPARQLRSGLHGFRAGLAEMPSQIR